MKTGIQQIEEERARHAELGWDADHDSYLREMELPQAARCYLGHAIGTMHGMGVGTRPPAEWPWHSEYWKPSSDPKRDLVRAGALIAAEIDRMQQDETVGKQLAWLH